MTYSKQDKSVQAITSQKSSRMSGSWENLFGPAPDCTSVTDQYNATQISENFLVLLLL